jgi:hypothetical protein
MCLKFNQEKCSGCTIRGWSFLNFSIFLRGLIYYTIEVLQYPNLKCNKSSFQVFHNTKSQLMMFITMVGFFFFWIISCFLDKVEKIRFPFNIFFYIMDSYYSLKEKYKAKENSIILSRTFFVLCLFFFLLFFASMFQENLILQIFIVHTVSWSECPSPF